MQGHTSRIGHPVTGMMMKWVGPMALIVILYAPTAWTAEPVKITSLLTYPEAYKMKVVQVEGTVQNYRMNHFIGERSKLEKCIQIFSVEDGTGSVDASYATICQMGTIMLKDGDQVTVEGHFLGTLDVRSVRK
ncbi:MAG: hypothetical protein KF722_18740, partial [Nitrospira sp.]|nr:hypothetical protein [Nitrospira sp.]